MLQASHGMGVTPWDSLHRKIAARCLPLCCWSWPARAAVAARVPTCSTRRKRRPRHARRSSRRPKCRARRHRKPPSPHRPRPAPAKRRLQCRRPAPRQPPCPIRKRRFAASWPLGGKPGPAATCRLTWRSTRRVSRPAKAARPAGRQTRQRVIGKAGEIELTLGRADIRQRDAQRVSASFTQQYRSNSKTDSGVKTLQFRLIDGQWLIEQESFSAAQR